MGSCGRLQLFGFGVVLFNVANVIFLALALWLENFYKDGNTMENMHESITFMRYERGVVKGLFMAAFIICINSLFQTFIHTLGSMWKKIHKTNAIIGTVLIWCAFILSLAGVIYIGVDNNVKQFVVKSSPYGFTIAATVTTGLGSFLSVPYIRYAWSAEYCPNNCPKN